MQLLATVDLLSQGASLRREQLAPQYDFMDVQTSGLFANKQQVVRCPIGRWWRTPHAPNNSKLLLGPGCAGWQPLLADECLPVVLITALLNSFFA